MHVNLAQHQDLEDARASALQTIDRAAHERRQRDITPGMETVYAQKLVEALEHVACLNSETMQSTAEYERRMRFTGEQPFLTAEADALGIAMRKVAQQIIAAHDEAKQINAAVERERMTGKKLVREAPTVEVIAAARHLAVNAIREL